MPNETRALPSAKDVFLQATKLANNTERKLFLDQQCDGNEQLRKKVEALLSSLDENDVGLLDQIVDAFAPQDTATVPLNAQTPWQPTFGLTEPTVPQQIGPYTIREQIGEGGMGTVYVAEQKEPVRRKVALKIIRAGMASKEIVARFEAERQALAMMEHPNIARVIDGGTTPTGQPFFAMELVQGTPITQYADAHRMSIPERLAMFVKVCLAVQHAHRKGIIHRDLKPSNVLVA
jgi:serine/threonine protein kinase